MESDAVTILGISDSALDVLEENRSRLALDLFRAVRGLGLQPNAVGLLQAYRLGSQVAGGLTEAEFDVYEGAKNACVVAVPQLLLELRDLHIKLNEESSCLQQCQGELEKIRLKYGAGPRYVAVESERVPVGARYTFTSEVTTALEWARLLNVGGEEGVPKEIPLPWNRREIGESLFHWAMLDCDTISAEVRRKLGI